MYYYCICFSVFLRVFVLFFIDFLLPLTENDWGIFVFLWAITHYLHSFLNVDFIRNMKMRVHCIKDATPG